MGAFNFGVQLNSERQEQNTPGLVENGLVPLFFQVQCYLKIYLELIEQIFFGKKINKFVFKTNNLMDNKSTPLT